MKLGLVALVLGCICAAGAAIAVYTRAQLLDTGRYVQAVTPLASNPAVQRAVVARVEQEIERVVTVPAEARPLLHRTLVDIVASPEFRRVWVVGNRAAHAELVKVLTGRGAVQLSGNTVDLDLGPLVAAVQRELHSRGYHALDGIAPALAHLSFPLVQSSTVGHVRRGFRILDTLAWVLPFAALALLAIAVWRWPRTSRGLVWAGVGLAVTAGVLLGALVLSRWACLRAFRRTCCRATPPARSSTRSRRRSGWTAGSRSPPPSAPWFSSRS